MERRVPAPEDRRDGYGAVRGVFQGTGLQCDDHAACDASVWSQCSSRGGGLFQSDCPRVADSGRTRSAGWRRHPVHEGRALKLFLVLVKPKAEPVLISDSFAWGSFFVGPIWLAARRAWIAAGLSLATYVLIAFLPPPLLAAILSLSVAVFLGLHGHDLQVWALEHR